MRKLAQMAQISVTDEEVRLLSYVAVEKAWSFELRPSMLHRSVIGARNLSR